MAIQGKKAQKVHGRIVTALGFSALAPIFTHDFVPNPTFSKYAFYLAVLLGILYTAILLFSQREKLKTEFNKKSRWGKTKDVLLFSFATPVIFSMIFWSLVAITLPHIYTSIFGNLTYKSAYYETDYGSKYECRYQLEPDRAPFSLSHFCISNYVLNHLPEGDLKTQLTVKESKLGYIALSFKILKNSDGTYLH